MALPRFLAGALAAISLTVLPTAQAGSFTATALAEIGLLSAPIDGVTINVSNAVVLNQGGVSNPAWAFYDNDALLSAPPGGPLGNTLVVVGEAEAPRGESAEVNAGLWTDGAIEIINTTNDPVELQFSYLFDLLAHVVARPNGVSVANAFARVELWWDVDTILDELVTAALDGVTSVPLAGSGEFSIAVPAGETRTISLFLDAGGDASHVPLPASPLLLGLGLLGLFGVARRR